MLELTPSKIRFMHHQISNEFRNGISVNQTVEDIANGRMSVNQLPSIRVVKRNGYYYAFDNRRLYVYRVLEYRGLLTTVSVNKASLSQFQPGRFSTLNNGASVTLKRGGTLPHIVADPSPSADSEDEEDPIELALQRLHIVR